MKIERTAIFAVALAIGAAPMFAQEATQQTTQTTTTTSATASGPVVEQPATHHQLKKDERADKDQSKADAAEAKAANSKKVRKADDKQDQADRSAAKADSPY